MFWKYELTDSSLIFMSVYSCLFICTDNEKLASINENYELFMTENVPSQLPGWYFV